MKAAREVGNAEISFRQYTGEFEEWEKEKQCD